MNRPEHSSAGELIPESFDKLSFDELSLWVRARLLGLDPSYTGAPGDMPHYVIAYTFHRLSRRVREDIETIIIDLLRAVSKGEKEWLGSAGEELLLLADPILLATPRRGEVIDLLLAICGLLDRGTESRCSLRAAQALVTLDFFPSPRFWIDLCARNGALYIPVSLEGIARADLRAAIQWLSENNWEDAFSEPFLRLLPLLLEKYGSGALRREIAGAATQIPKHIREDLQEIALSEGFDIFGLDAKLEEEEALEIALALTGLLEDYLSGLDANFTPVVRALAALNRLMPRLRNKKDSGSPLANNLWRSYVQSLQASLQHEELARIAYQQLVSQLPPSEAVDITRLVLDEGYLSRNEVKDILLPLFGGPEIRAMIGKHELEAADAMRSASLSESLVAALKGDSLGSVLRSQDLAVPRDERAWAQSILTHFEQN